MTVALDRLRDPNLLTIAQAAAVAGVHRNTIRTWCQSARLSSVLVNRRGDRRLYRADLERFLAARSEAQAEEERRRAAGSSQDLVLSDRLRAIRDLAVRFSHRTDVAGVGEAIVEAVGSLIDNDSVRVYRVDHEAGACEPIAFRGRFAGVEEPSVEMLRVRIGEGLTGWVAAHNESVRLGDAAADPRRLSVGQDAGPESILLVPMAADEQTVGVIVLSKIGCDRFTPDHETTLTIFAGHAAQALLSVERHEQLVRQQVELEQRLASQRRLLAVNEQLVSTLDPTEVFELIADSLKAVVAYDTLGIYVIDRSRSVRRAVVARDRFADAVLTHESAIDAGITGWVIAKGEALLANDVHLDPRSTQIPGTPFEPESMVIVPLIVNGEVRGTLNVGRIGEVEAHFSEDEFELVRLFAGQASVALQNAETHRAVETRAAHDQLTGLRNHGEFQRELGEAVAAGGQFAVLMMDLDRFKAYNDAFGHPAGDDLLGAVAVAIGGAVRDGDQAYRYGGDEFAVILPQATRHAALEVGERIRRAVQMAADPSGAIRVTISIGAAVHPMDGLTKDDIISAADQALYLSKPSHGPDASDGSSMRDIFLAALNDTALALMERHGQTDLLETIIAHATGLMGTPHGYVYLAEPDRSAFVVRVGTGVFGDFIGLRLGPREGLVGKVAESSKSLIVHDYDAWDERASALPKGVFGSILGVPLTSGGEVVGVVGVASGRVARRFGERDVAILERFAQLASIALDNDRLLVAAETSEARFRLLSDAAMEALAIHRDGSILEANRSFADLFGYEPSELAGRRVADLVPPSAVAENLALIEGTSDEPHETVALARDGIEFPIEIVTRTIPYLDGQVARVASIRDLRERRAMEERLTREALYDRVTGLPNRRLLTDRLAEALESDPAAGSVGFILLDVDRFKMINETMGHSSGDALLEATGRRLFAAVRPGDIVARFGGDEFAILLADVADVAAVRTVAERIDDAMRSPFRVGGREVFVSVSMGVAVGRPREAEADGLMRDAEVALQRAKKEDAAAHIAVFEPSMSVATRDRVELEHDLRLALERGELVLHFQPIVDLATGAPLGAEALVRWEHPRRGLVAPGDFIRVAEETGLIVPLGRWVIREACRQAVTWEGQGGRGDLPIVSVNLSARQFLGTDLGAEIAAILEETKLPPSRLELEITESVAMDRSELGLGALKAVREMGVRIALDDFGTGYSSLAYLRDLPLDILKIDRAFVAKLGSDSADTSIVSAVVGLARGLGIGVVAEGIETTGQLAVLRGLGCDRGQGFLFSPPVPAGAIDDLLRGRHFDPAG
ncbi:MAG TPA: diguanylate cyclase [Candidatus Limnocylindrales bacterium]|nr:diguanylate cyclase [Candidatus Limnocylindrales bacterium]